MSFRYLLRALPRTPSATASVSALGFNRSLLAAAPATRLFSIQSSLSDDRWSGRSSRNGSSRTSDSRSFGRSRSSGGRPSHRRSNEQRDMTPMESLAPKSVPAFTKFSELSGEKGVHDVLVRNLTGRMKLDVMTEVQQQTIEHTLAGEDVIGQAKTGTGKTLAFLVPLVNQILAELPFLADSKIPFASRPQIGDTRALVISPTRELAEQTAAEAEKLLAGTSVQVQIAVGGTQKRAALQDMQRRGCHLLVATPGRLKDLLQDPHSGVSIDHLQGLVLDEADRLLDDGFWPDIQEIVRALPDTTVKPRQTLLFSATMTRDVQKLARQVIKPNFASISTVDPNEEPTHTRIPQHLVLTRGYENLMPALLELCSRGLQESQAFKAVVFYNSTAEVSLAARIFRSLGYGSSHPLHPARIYELHGQLTQAQRTNAADSFRRSDSAILFASDVAARGMDFPGVTDVVQISAPSQVDTYIHRIGRTGRAGRDGTGWLIAPELEHRDMRHLSSLPLKRSDSLTTATLDMTVAAELPRNQASILTSLGEAVRKTDDESRRSVYANLLYRMIPNGRDMRGNQEAVDAVNRLARFGWGMPEPPAIRPPGQMGQILRDLTGLTFQTRDQFDQRREGSEGGSRFGQRDGGSRFGQRDGGSRFGQRDGGSRFGQRDGGSRFGQREGGREGDRDGGSRFGQRDGGSRFGQRDGGRGRDGGQRYGQRDGERREGGRDNWRQTRDDAATAPPQSQTTQLE